MIQKNRQVWVICFVVGDLRPVYQQLRRLIPFRLDMMTVITVSHCTYD